MQIRNKLVVILILLSIFVVVDTVAASSFIRPSANTTTVTFAVIIVAVAVIIGFLLFHGGVKYVTPENVLDTEIRKHLYDYIDESPGSHLREIARELDLKPSNAAWHLRKLEQTNLVRSRFIGGKKVYYLVEGGIDGGEMIAFNEVELGGKTEYFGKIGHRISAYASYFDGAEEIGEKGVNSFQVLKVNGKWLINSIIWDVEKNGQSIPERYLTEK